MSAQKKKPDGIALPRVPPQKRRSGLEKVDVTFSKLKSILILLLMIVNCTGCLSECQREFSRKDLEPIFDQDYCNIANPLVVSALTSPEGTPLSDIEKALGKPCEIHVFPSEHVWLVLLSLQWPANRAKEGSIVRYIVCDHREHYSELLLSFELDKNDALVKAKALAVTPSIKR